VLIGYSFWGFLGHGITDTPDGGRSHRRILIDGLIDRGHEIVFLQANGDLTKAGEDLTEAYRWDAGLPGVDVLFLEYRWPIPGRNTIACGTPGHTCDRHRQQQLLDRYTAAGVPTVVWDKDRQLLDADPLRYARGVIVCEAALYPTPGAATLLFPVDDRAVDAADAVALTAGVRDIPLVYVGNQYDRDEAFEHYLAPVARTVPHVVAGKWARTDRWPDVSFAGRIPFSHVEKLYQRALATVLLLPKRYASAGQMTQRLFESVLNGCLPLTPATIRDANRFTPPALHVHDGAEAATRLDALMQHAGTARHAELLDDCLRRLDIFRLSRQLDRLEDILAVRTEATRWPGRRRRLGVRSHYRPGAWIASSSSGAAAPARPSSPAGSPASSTRHSPTSTPSTTTPTGSPNRRTSSPPSSATWCSPIGGSSRATTPAPCPSAWHGPTP
jgi:hypothetical protein